jgi:hypothetical protein
VRVTPVAIAFLSRDTQQLMSDAILRVDNAVSNFIPAGGFGSNMYDVYLTSVGAKLERPILQTIVEGMTDQQAIDMTRRLAPGYITEQELRALSRSQFTYQLRLN